MSNIEQIKKLRKQTGVGISDAKKAVEQSNGDLEKAIDFLRKQGAKLAAKKSDREAKEGIIETYTHGIGKVGVMLELNCETDFVAKNEDFKTLAHDLALHVAANDPQCLKPEDVNKEDIQKEEEIAKEQMAKDKKPEEIKEKIIKNKIEKFKQEQALLTQPFLKNDKITVQERIQETIAKVGENIQVGRFVRYKI